MNGYQRIVATLENRPSDSLACMPITMMFAAKLIDVPYREYATDYRTLVRGQIHLAREFGLDLLLTISDPAREAADHGADICYFDDTPPALNENNSFLADKTRLKSMKILDPLAPGSRMLDRVQAVREYAKVAKHELFIEGWIEGPCAEAADLRGINHLMYDFVDDPNFVHELFDFNVRNAIPFAEEQIKAGADSIGIGDAAASLIGPKRYKEFVYPYEKKLVDAIHATGAKVRLHICGNISRSLPEIGTLGFDMVDIDSMVPLEKARNEMGPDQVICGNMDPVGILYKGNPDMVRDVLAECHRIAGDRFIVGAGCEVPRDTPHENFRAMMEYARSHGRA
ncbi:MAG: uroporphyrinogen decarboxylase family protein [Planctomycetaceae bacterium]|nr:uroporphyrinogen decarboxylase family protein [Planctomycetaceae bacterium]